MYILVKNFTLNGKEYIITKREDGTVRKKFIDFKRPFNNLTSRFNQLYMFRERYWRSKYHFMWPYKEPYGINSRDVSFEFPPLNLSYDEPSVEYTHWVAPAWVSGILDNIREEKLYGPSTLPTENTDMSYIASSLEEEM